MPDRFPYYEWCSICKHSHGYGETCQELTRLYGHPKDDQSKKKWLEEEEEDIEER